MFLPIIFSWVLNRITEPSTWAGAAAVVHGANGVVPTDVMGSIQSIAVGVCGLVAIFLKERNK